MPAARPDQRCETGWTHARDLGDSCSDPAPARQCCPGSERPVLPCSTCHVSPVRQSLVGALSGRRGREAPDTLSAAQAERVKARVRLLIEITARAGEYRKGLLTAVAQLSREEAAIVADLERHGLQVPQLHD